MKEIPLTQNKIALIDDEDYEKVNQYKWCAHKKKKTFLKNLRKLETNDTKR